MSKDFVVDMHFVMEEESIMTDEVVVSANRNETSRKVAPVVVNVMSNKLFEIVNSTDLAKSLNYQSKQLPELRFPSGAHQWIGGTLFTNPD